MAALARARLVDRRVRATPPSSQWKIRAGPAVTARGSGHSKRAIQQTVADAAPQQPDVSESDAEHDGDDAVPGSSLAS